MKKIMLAMLCMFYFVIWTGGRSYQVSSYYQDGDYLVANSAVSNSIYTIPIRCITQIVEKR